MIPITITKEERALCANFATLLNEHRKAGKPTPKKRNDFYKGNLGEYGYGKYNKLPVNFVLTEAGKGDGGADFPGVQIKTATYDGDGELELNVRVNDKCFTNPTVNKIVLMFLPLKESGLKVYIVGDISVDNFKKRCRISRYENTLVVDASQLDNLY